MPKRENFELAFFYTKWSHLGKWLGNEAKKRFFISSLLSTSFWFFSAGLRSVRYTFFRPKLKVVGGCFWAHMYAYNVFVEKFSSYSCLQKRSSREKYFLANTRLTGNNFCRWISSLEILPYTEYTLKWLSDDWVCAKQFLANTQSVLKN